MKSNICRQTYLFIVLAMFSEKKYLQVAALSTAINGGDIRNAESWMVAIIMVVGMGVAMDEPQDYPYGRRCSNSLRFAQTKLPVVSIHMPKKHLFSKRIIVQMWL